MAKGRDLSKMPNDIQEKINNNLKEANMVAAREASVLMREAYAQAVAAAGSGVKSSDRSSYTEKNATLEISGNNSYKKYYGKSKWTTNEYAEGGGIIRPRVWKGDRLTRPVIHAKRITINNVLDLTFRQGIYGLPAYSEHTDWVNPKFVQKPSSISVDGISVSEATPELAMNAFVDELSDGGSSRMSKAFTEALFG